MSILIMLLLLSLLILVHEAGHFLAARAFGIKVEKFGFGLPIGPTLFEKKFGDVTILVHAFLLGGYVAFPDDEKDCDLPADSEERFLNKPIYQRAIVVSAGVISNVICAYLIVLFAAFHWGNLPSGKYDVFVNDIIAPKSESIWQSGLKKGDQIISLNNTNITNTSSLISIISHSKPADNFYDKGVANENLAKLRELNVAFTEDEIIPKGVTVILPERIDEPAVTMKKEVEMGIIKYEHPSVELDKNLIELRNELNNGNQQYYTGNEKYSLSDIAKALADYRHPLVFQVKRNNEKITLKPMYTDNEGKIGIQLAQKNSLIKTTNPLAVIKYSTIYLYENTYNMVYGLGQIFTGRVPLKDLHGIVAITKVGGDIISNSGMFYGLLLTAIISMDLAIVNFLPIPALDGGHVMFLIIEKFRGKRLNDETIEKIGTFFFTLLIILMIVVIFNDIIWLKG